MNLIDLPLNEALAKKFEAGRIAHNNSEEFVGDPLNELFQECLDAMNYCNEALKRGIDLTHRHRQFWAAALEVQTIHRNRNRRSQQ